MFCFRRCLETRFDIQTKPNVQLLMFIYLIRKIILNITSVKLYLYLMLQFSFLFQRIKTAGFETFINDDGLL